MLIFYLRKNNELETYSEMRKCFDNNYILTTQCFLKNIKIISDENKYIFQKPDFIFLINHNILNNSYVVK